MLFAVIEGIFILPTIKILIFLNLEYLFHRLKLIPYELGNVVLRTFQTYILKKAS